MDSRTAKTRITSEELRAEFAKILGERVTELTHEELNKQGWYNAQDIAEMQNVTRRRAMDMALTKMRDGKIERKKFRTERGCFFYYRLK